MIGDRLLKNGRLFGLKNLSRGSVRIRNTEASESVAGTYLGMLQYRRNRRLIRVEVILVGPSDCHEAETNVVAASSISDVDSLCPSRMV